LCRVGRRSDHCPTPLKRGHMSLLKVRPERRFIRRGLNPSGDFKQAGGGSPPFFPSNGGEGGVMSGVLRSVGRGGPFRQKKLCRYVSVRAEALPERCGQWFPATQQLGRWSRHWSPPASPPWALSAACRVWLVEAVASRLLNLPAPHLLTLTVSLVTTELRGCPPRAKRAGTVPLFLSLTKQLNTIARVRLPDPQFEPGID